MNGGTSGLGKREMRLMLVDSLRPSCNTQVLRVEIRRIRANLADLCRTPYRASSRYKIAKAALVILKNIGPTLISHRFSRKEIVLVLAPAYGFRWAEQLSTSVGAEATNYFIRWGKGDALHKEKINEIRHRFTETFYDEVGPTIFIWTYGWF